MLSTPVSNNANPEALRAALQERAQLDVFVAVTRHSCFVAALNMEETTFFINRVKAKTDENPKLLAFAKAVYALCWDDEVSAEAKRSFLDLNMVFLDPAFNVNETENAYLIEQFTQEALYYKKHAGLGRQREYLKLFAEHFRLNSTKLKKRIEEHQRLELRLKELLQRVLMMLTHSLGRLAEV